MRLGSSKNKAKVYGGPLRFGATRRRLAAYRDTSVWMITLAWLTVIIVTAVVATSNGHSGWGTAAVLATIAVTTHVAIKWPSVSATLVLLVVFAPIWVRVAVLYSVSSTGSAGLGATWFVFAALGGGIAVIAHQTSRARPWVTVLIALTAITILGPLTLIVWPHGGFLVACGYAGLVLLVRSRTWPLIVDTCLGAVSKLKSTWGSVDNTDEIWERGAEAEERTGAHLANLPAGFYVFHNRAVKGASENVDHLVIGPTGVWALTSVMLPGAVTTDPDLGLMADGATLTGALTGAIERSDMVAKGLGLRRSGVSTLFVVHGASLEAPRQVARVLNSAEAFLGEVTVLAPDQVLAEVDNPLEEHSARVVKGLRRRAARKFSVFAEPAAAATETSSSSRVSKSRARGRTR